MAVRAPYYTQAEGPFDPQDALSLPPALAGTAAPGMDSYPSYQQQQQQQQQHYQQHVPGAGAGPPSRLQKKFARSTAWSEREAAVQASSPFGHLPGWRLRLHCERRRFGKEMLAQQVLEMMRQVFTSARLDILLTPYQIVPTGANVGLVEFINARSIDRMKKSSPDVPTLKEYFEYTYGLPTDPVT